MKASIDHSLTEGDETSLERIHPLEEAKIRTGSATATVQDE